MSKAIEAAAKTPMSDHVARFWQLLETEHVRILVDMRREVGTESRDGPVVYWDCASFSDDVAKALVADRAPVGVDRAALPHLRAGREGWPPDAIERLVERLETLADHGAASMADAQEVAADAWALIRALSSPPAPSVSEGWDRGRVYLKIVENWIRNNRGITFVPGAVDDLCDRIAIVLSPPAPAPEGEWREIGNVPKGERIELYNELWEETYGAVQIGVRMDDAADIKWMFDSGMDISSDTNWTEDGLTPEDYEPTHWRPLPAPPIVAEAKAKP